MPKQVNFVPNERVDLDDLTYGTSTFPVDSLKAHVQRLISGDYNGGFVLEGFRVEIDLTLGDRRIYVHNGIAIDRDGRLITFEDGDNFSKNIDIKKEYILDSNPVNHYIMVEFAFDDTDDDTRAVWDPTYENASIIDSAGNTHAAPNGREFPLNIPTRRAISWRIVSETGGFDDRGDLGTEGHTLRIPIAIIKVTGVSIDIGVPGFVLENPWTTVIETPQPDDTILVCANTRLFADEGQVNILDRLGGVRVAADYSTLDDDNNVIAGIDNGAGILLTDVKAGDIVYLTEVPTGTTLIPNFLQAGNRWDARPMLFSFTDPVADSEETDLLKRNPRNQRFAAGIALLRKYVIGTTTVEFPSVTATAYKLQLTANPDRVEDNLKQEQDFFRAMGAIVREMKYGDPIDLYYSGLHGPSTYDLSSTPAGVTNTRSQFGFYLASDHPGFYDGLNTSLIGANLEFVSGGNVGEIRTITSISSNVWNFLAQPDTFYYIVTVDSNFTNPIVAAEHFSITKALESNTKFVDNYNMGNLNEVYRARIDRITNSWTSDLQERLAANKVPVVTVGDGFKTFGDFNGNEGLRQAFLEVENGELGGIIYIKRGSYLLSDPIDVSSNTIVMGEGPDSTTVTFSTTSDRFIFKPFFSIGDDTVYNVQFKDISLIGGITAVAGTTGFGSVISNTDATSYPVINLTIDNCYMKGGSFFNDTYVDPAFRERRLFSLLYLGIAPARTEASKNIKILNSRFFIGGSGFYFQTCRKVQIDGCIFETETNLAGVDFEGLVEGIVFDEGDSFVSGSQYGHSDATAALVEGEVSISNCKFRGPHTELLTTPARGWIFFSPGFSGQNSSVTNCHFIGDTEGDDGPTTVPFSNAARTKWGTGIVSGTTEIVFVNNCMFHSYVEGIRAVAGKTIINDCSFIEMTRGVFIGKPNAGVTSYDFDYTAFNPGWLFGTAVDFDTQIRGCSFSGKYTPSNEVGVSLLPQQLFTRTNSVVVSNCDFSNITNGISYIEISDYTILQATLPSAPYYTILDINSCVFKDIKECALEGYYATNIWTEPSNNRMWAFKNVYYNNNTHTAIQTDNSGAGAINISGENCSISQNIVRDITFNTLAEYVFGIYAPNSLVFNDNTILECYPTVNSATIILEHLFISVMSQFPTLSIEDNIIDVAGSENDKGICNGVRVATAIIQDGTIFPELRLSGNKFKMKNANYIFMARQDDGGSLSRQFLWEHADVTNNTFENICALNRVSNFASHGNSEGYPMYGDLAGPDVGYLGAANIGLPADTYCGIIDLRMFRKYDSTTGANTPANNYCNIVGNNIFVNSGAISPPQWETGYFECRLVGIRISAWPCTIKVSDNTSSGAPVFLHNEFWNYRNDPGGHATGATRIEFTNNNIKDNMSLTDPLFFNLVSISPATGGNNPSLATGGPDAWPGHAALLGSPIYQTTSIKMANNIFESPFGQQGSASYQDQRSVILLGGLNFTYQGSTVYTDGDDNVGTENLSYNWQINDNQFLGMPFLVDGHPVGATGNALGLLTCSTGEATGWTANTSLPEGLRLIVVENNTFMWGNSSPFLAGHIFGTLRRCGVARLYCTDNILTPNTGDISSIIHVLATNAAVVPSGFATYPDTTGTAVLANGTIQSYLIVQNNSAFNTDIAGAKQIQHAFTGSWIDQG